MLVLSRRIPMAGYRPEEILIGSHDRDVVIPAGTFVRIVVVEVRPDKVRLGFEASESIPILRSEIAGSVGRNGMRRDHDYNGNGEDRR